MRVSLAAALLAAAFLLAACGDHADLTVAEGSGSEPMLPPPKERLIPTVNIAPAQGWPASSTMRTSMPGSAGPTVPASRGPSSGFEVIIPDSVMP